MLKGLADLEGNGPAWHALRRPMPNAIKVEAELADQMQLAMVVTCMLHPEAHHR